MPTPLDYFIKYFPESLFVEMAGITNIYAQQTGVVNYKETSSNEMKVFIGVHLLMGFRGQNVLALKVYDTK